VSGHITPHLPAKTISVFRRLHEYLHALACPSKSQAGGRDPAIYVLIKHFLAVFLSLLCILYYSAKYSLRSTSAFSWPNKIREISEICGRRVFFAPGRKQAKIRDS